MPATSAPLGAATQQLLALAATFPCLARKMQLRLVNDSAPERAPVLEYSRNVPWLAADAHGIYFAPDKFAACIGPWSTGEKYCAQFLLNVWNTSYARSKRWRFDLFDFIGTCGSSSPETEAVIAWMQNPVWP